MNWFEYIIDKTIAVLDKLDQVYYKYTAKELMATTKGFGEES